MANNNMNFGVDLLPTQDNTYSLGDATHKWKINGVSPVNIQTQTNQALYPITIDSLGHISAYGTANTINDSTLLIKSNLSTGSSRGFKIENTNAENKSVALILTGTGNMGLYDTTTGASGWIVRKQPSGTTNFYGTATNATNDGNGDKISTTYLKTDSISFSASLTSGTKIGAITINGTTTDLYCQTNTNTHRPIQVDGTEILGNNTTALNLKAGSNVSIINSSGAVTIAAIDTNTWRPVSDSVSSSSSSDAASSKAVKTAYDLAASKTSNTGTVTSVATGVGLTGGSITTSGTIKAKLRSETALTNDCAVATETAGRIYPVAVDKTGYLAVNIPWTDENVKQTNVTNDNNYALLLANTTTETAAGVNKSSRIYWNPGAYTLGSSNKLIIQADTHLVFNRASTGNLYIRRNGITKITIDSNDNIYPSEVTNAPSLGTTAKPWGAIYGSQVWGAVWNDYAEFRKDNVKEKELQQPGRCVREVGDGTLTLTDGRLQRGCEIISDTFGFAIGQDKENGYNTPIASSGRVLAYLYEDRELAHSFIGWPVCSGPNGTVSIMTEEEENRYSNRIVGTISEIPDYEEWGTGKVKVDGRIWIRIK